MTASPRVAIPLVLITAAVAIAVSTGGPSPLHEDEQPSERNQLFEDGMVKVQFLPPGAPSKTELSPFPVPGGLIRRARVHITFSVHNRTTQPDDAVREFPIFAPPYRKDGWCRLKIDDQPVEFEVHSLLTNSLQLSLSDQQAPWTEWVQRLEAWIQADAKLRAMVDQYQTLAGDRQTLTDVTEEFKKEIKQHLINSELALNAQYVARGDSYFGHLVSFMPEVDPALRIDEPYQRWKYISVLSSFTSEIYRPYEAEWRLQADEWFSSKPALKNLVPRLRSAWTSFEQGQTLLTGPVMKYLHDEKGLSLQGAVAFRSYLHNGARFTSLIVLSR